jgi:cation transporter-like permease
MTVLASPVPTSRILQRALLASNVGFVLYFINLVVVAYITGTFFSDADAQWRGDVVTLLPAVISVISVWLASQARRATRALQGDLAPGERMLRKNVTVFSLIVIIGYMATSFFAGFGSFMISFFGGQGATGMLYVALILNAGAIVIGISRGIIAPKGASDE